MLFNSAIFVFLYLPIVWIGYLLALKLPWARAGIAWLGLASVFFYGYWNPAFVPLLAASIVFNYAIGRLLDKSVWNAPVRSRKMLMVSCICINLVALLYYKYANLLFASAAALTGAAMPLLDVVLPLGISFYTFTQIAYIVDSHATGKSEKSFLAYLLFVTFFPHLIAGPVLHHREMMPQFLDSQKSAIRMALVIEGLLFFCCGLAKKVLIADSVAPAANQAFTLASSHTLGFTDSWFGVLAYATQIYFDFSGYSDMAIGLGLLFGVRLPLNFNSPYKATSMIDFWRRWHMTLSRFLRDYLYIPLGGGRCGPMRRQLNLMITMLLGGLWHGASWTFLAWGGLHGAYLQLNHLWRHMASRSPTVQKLLARHSKPAALCSWMLTFLAALIAWVFFRAESFAAASNLLQGMFAGSSSIDSNLVDTRTASYVAIGLLLAFFAPNSQQLFAGASAKLSERGRQFVRSCTQGSQLGALLFLIIALTMISMSWGVNEFIYFNF